MGGGSFDFEKLKRQFLDLVYDLHARKLAIPAAALVAAIFAAIFVLPKSPSPPPPVNTAPTADQSQSSQPKTQTVAALKMVNATPLDDNSPLIDSHNPFTGNGKPYACVRVGKSNPYVLDCKVGDLVVRVICPVGNTSSLCTPASGASGATGSSGTSGGSSGGGGSTGGGTGGGGSSPKAKSTYYVVSVSLDGRTYSNVIAGDGLPNEKNALAVFAGVTDSHSKAIFIAGDSVTVTGVTVDPDLGNFELAKGKTATLTDAAGAAHKLKLNSIKKVTK